MITIQSLTLQDIDDTMLNEFDRSQQTTRVLYAQGEELLEKEDCFDDDWSSDQKREITSHFRKVLQMGGSVIAAFEKSDMASFAVIEGDRFGSRNQYVELSFIHVSREFRGRGIGEELMNAAKVEAKQLGAFKLYISAHPSVRTQAFYKKTGCVLAAEVNGEIYQREPRDIQLECPL
jgi:ribosomal protein S18 acetylase RimI-like enzyme